MTEAIEQRVAAGGRSGPMPWDGRACERAFQQSAKSKTWTIGYRNAIDERLAVDSVDVRGSIPKELRGTFYRNGPAMHARGGARYGHRWDGDGMVQAFAFDQGRVAHRGAFVRTEKWEQESRAGTLLFSAFGSRLPGSEPVPERLDTMNPANISVIRIGDELLALWEAGSAYVMDPSSLETKGVKTWAEPLRGQPFSAHPRREPDGTVWNFGVDPFAGHLFIYCIDRAGRLLQHRFLEIDRLPPVHDFAVTARHLVFVLPSLEISIERLHAGSSFGEAFAWRPDRGMRVLLVDKATFDIRTVELPPGCLFHMGNAWEESSGTIRFDMMMSRDPRPLVSGWSIMRGQYQHAGGANLVLVEVPPVGTARLERHDEIEGEFPVVAPGAVGQRHDNLLLVTRGAGRAEDVVGYDEVAMFDTASHDVVRFGYGDDWLVEEHLLVPDPRDPNGEAKWIVGTALNMAAERTVVSVFDARSLGAGPLAQATLPYPLPLGLHGRFELVS